MGEWEQKILVSIGSRAIESEVLTYFLSSINTSHYSSPNRSFTITDAERSYTQIKELGDGSFGTVWLCDWHSPIRQDHMLSAMQCGAGSRPEWAGKRLVALKMMKKVWENGWDQAKTLGELAVSLAVEVASI
jgi:serine/threonine protein kinase